MQMGEDDKGDFSRGSPWSGAPSLTQAESSLPLLHAPWPLEDPGAQAQHLSGRAASPATGGLGTQMLMLRRPATPSHGVVVPAPGQPASP